ncbi:hypothetical protein KVR01_002667 [Diaporthe batatas]|uniref:uncharacterized protein n=1 Tax=Diaporthe batatas TaxID=748121 RepID=UPI001D04A02D|nr:uncharacterized protein KVR01_002667 [Diaporthe batatas]KAG8166978.1 hypothetical protein KVR01_002667 [Diaporthe batatas]
MESLPSTTTPSPPSSPPASLLVETIDYRNNTTAESVVQEPTQELLGPASPSSSDGSNRTITQRDVALPASPSASSDHTITRGDLAGPAHQSSQPPQNPPTFPAITDHIATNAALDNLEPQYQYGVGSFPHIHLQIGRELRAKPKTMDPAPPARVVQRNDSPVNWPIPNGDPNDKRVASKGRTPCLGPRVVTYNNIKEGTKEVVETPTTATAAAGATPAAPPSAPAKVPGVSGTEGLAGLGDELEALVLTKVEYAGKFRVFRERWNKVLGELAAKAKQVEGARFTTAAELRPLVGAVGVMFAVGKAVDCAAFPGVNVGQFVEKDCSPEVYLSSLFPELNASAGTGGVVLPQQWDFSLDAVMASERRGLLREVWAAAAAGQWEAVEEKTSSTLAKAEELAEAE